MNFKTTLKRILKRKYRAIKRKLKETFSEKRIAIIAYEKTHYEVVSSIIQRNNPRRNCVEVFTHKKGIDEIKAGIGNLSNNVIWRSVTKTPFDLKKIRKMDVVILPSPEYKPEKYIDIVRNPNRKYKTIAMLHNLNYDMYRGEQQKELFNKADELAVLDSTLLQTLRSRGEDRVIHVFWPVCEIDRINETKENELRITISGWIESKRRDYETVIATLKQLPEDGKLITVTLLGRPSKIDGKEIIDEFKEIRNPRITIRTFDAFIPTETFNCIMQEETDVLLVPNKRETEFRGVKEYYGETKGQGAVNEAIRFAKPIISTSIVRMPEELENGVIYYDNIEELCSAIIKCEDTSYLNEMKIKAFDCAKAIK